MTVTINNIRAEPMCDLLTAMRSNLSASNVMESFYLSLAQSPLWQERIAPAKHAFSWLYHLYSTIHNKRLKVLSLLLRIFIEIQQNLLFKLKLVMNKGLAKVLNDS